MRKKIFYTALSLALLLVAGCSDKEDMGMGPVVPEDQFDNIPGAPEEALTLARVMTEEGYTPDEFMKHLGSPSMAELFNYIPLPLGINMSNMATSLAKVKLNAHLPQLDSLFAAEVGTEADGSRRWRFESYTFTYKSLTAAGQTIEMSGRVTFPNNTVKGVQHKVSSLTLHSHQALFFPDDAPSDNMMFMPMRAMYNSAVIEPDFQNYGINRGKVLDATCSTKAMTRQLVDCAIAALQVMQQHGVALAPDGYTTNWGSSKCVSVPIHFAKYYETQAPQWFRDAIRLKSTFTGEGPFDWGEIMPHFFQNPGLYQLCLNFMTYIDGFTASQLGGYEMKEILAPWLTNTTMHIGDGDYTLIDALSLSFLATDDPLMPEITRLDQILAPDLLTPEGAFDASNPKGQAFLNSLSKESRVDIWKPTLPIHIAHCPHDKAIPYSPARQYYLQLSNQETNPAVHWIDVPYLDLGLDVRLLDEDTDLHFIVAFIMNLHMACVKEPEDMAKVYGQR